MVETRRRKFRRIRGNVRTPAIADAAHNATASVKASARGRALGGSTMRAAVVGNSSSVSRIIVLLTMSGAACEMKLVLVAPPLAR
mgnify:CR=1 FL=1